ncbi:MAG: 50S ribosomal protein L24 [Simkaniaceae bacterium]
MSKWIKKEDKVVIITGNDKGKSGRVLAKRGSRVVVQGINIRKKHLRRQQKETKAEIVEMEMPIHISNVSLCDDNEKAFRPRVKVNGEGKKELYFLRDGKEVTFRIIK